MVRGPVANRRPVKADEGSSPSLSATIKLEGAVTGDESVLKTVDGESHRVRFLHLPPSRHSSMVEYHVANVRTWVRFPVPAPKNIKRVKHCWRCT